MQTTIFIGNCKLASTSQQQLNATSTPPHQALGIATKINKGTIEIVNDVHLIKPGDKVGASQATLLAKLGIKPFKYGLAFVQVSNSFDREPRLAGCKVDDSAAGELVNGHLM